MCGKNVIVEVHENPPILGPEYFEELSDMHTERLTAVRSVLLSHFYTYAAPEAWDLLIEAQQTSLANNEPNVIAGLLLDPSTGGWLSQLVPYEQKNLQTGELQEKDANFWWHTLHAHSIAASAAIQAGVPAFSIEVPAWSGCVTLPGLGQATLRNYEQSQEEGREMVRLTADPDTVTIEGCGNRVEIARSGGHETPEWKETARIVVDEPESATTWGVLLDDTNPYRFTSPPVAPAKDTHRLGRPTHRHSREEWVALTRAGMQLLVRDHPELARTMSNEIRSIVPLCYAPQAVRLKPYSASGSSTAGGVEVDFQHYPEIVAASLIHEGSHNRYYGLVLKQPFISEDWSNQPNYNSPWRSDVRPATGHLLGIDAFSNVAEFWRQRLVANTMTGMNDACLAEYEVAFLRSQVTLALEQIDADSDVLTAEGQAFIAHVLKPRIEQLQTKTITSRIKHMAEDAVNYHIAMWRAYHYRPAPSLIANVVQCWQKGVSCPDLTSVHDTLVPSKGYYFDLWSTFGRLCVGEPKIFEALVRNPQGVAEHVQGAQPRDLLCFAGRSEVAEREYTDELRHSKHIDPQTVVGLGFAFQEFHSLRASRILRAYPHTYRAVLERLMQSNVTRPDPISLVRWMAESST